MAANELEVIGYDASIFNWLAPQDGFELLEGARLLTKAMYDRSGVNNANFIPAKVDDFQSLYEILFRFKNMVQFCFTRYARADLAIGDIIPSPGFGNAVYNDIGLSWDYLESALGEDLSFFSDMVFNTIDPLWAGQVFEKSLLTTMYKIVDQFKEYISFSDQLRFDSVDELWADNGMGFDGSDAVDNEDQAEVYNALMDEIDDSANWTEYNNGSQGGNNTTFPQGVGARFRSFATDNDPDPDTYSFLLQRSSGGLISRSANFGHYSRTTNSGNTTYSGNFRGVLPDENTLYKEYLWGIRGDSTNYANFGSGINELELSLIQTAYSADGYILRCDPVLFNFTTLANQVPKDEGMYIGGCRTMNVNEERFSDYRT